MLLKRDILKKRSDLLQQIRAFFYARDVIEVDTPILSRGATPDVHLRSLATQIDIPGASGKQTFYLHTSPEYPMKRLLCEGSGDIFFLGKVFRDGDVSPRHQVEFTMLEWYRLGFNLQDLIEEVTALLEQVIDTNRRVEQFTFAEAFQQFAQIQDVFDASSEDFRTCLKRHQVADIVGVEDEDRALWQQLVLTEVIEPQLGQNTFTVITHFPAEDAALARISEGDSRTADRFEVFVDGMELANGYYELADGEQYEKRFELSLRLREACHLPKVPLDVNLIQSLKTKPLPNCSGVALGVDRLFMLQQGIQNIEHVVPFSIEKA